MEAEQQANESTIPRLKQQPINQNNINQQNNMRQKLFLFLFAQQFDLY